MPNPSAYRVNVAERFDEAREAVPLVLDRLPIRSINSLGNVLRRRIKSVPIFVTLDDGQDAFVKVGADPYEAEATRLWGTEVDIAVDVIEDGIAGVPYLVTKRVDGVALKTVLNDESVNPLNKQRLLREFIANLARGHSVKTPEHAPIDLPPWDEQEELIDDFWRIAPELKTDRRVQLAKLLSKRWWPIIGGHNDVHRYQALADENGDKLLAIFDIGGKRDTPFRDLVPMVSFMSGTGHSLEGCLEIVAKTYRRNGGQGVNAKDLGLWTAYQPLLTMARDFREGTLEPQDLANAPVALAFAESFSLAHAARFATRRE